MYFLPKTDGFWNFTRRIGGGSKDQTPLGTLSVYVERIENSYVELRDLEPFSPVKCLENRVPCD